MKSGVPDLCLPVPRGAYHGLYIEMKRLRGNTTTEDQDDWLEFLTRQGYLAVVCRGWEAASKIILGYLGMGAPGLADAENYIQREEISGEKVDAGGAV